jgi:hypothetical protein
MREQTLTPELMIINNGPRPLAAEIREGMRHVWIPFNAHPLARHLFSLYVETEWVMVIDDDLAPIGPTFIERALALAEQRPDAITGAWGCRLGDTPPYYNLREDPCGETEIITGRLMIHRRALLEQVRLSKLPMRYAPIASDIFLSLEIGQGQPVHFASRDLAVGLRALPAKQSVQDEIATIRQREEFCQYYMEHLT